MLDFVYCRYFRKATPTTRTRDEVSRYGMIHSFFEILDSSGAKFVKNTAKLDIVVVASSFFLIQSLHGSPSIQRPRQSPESHDI